MNRMIRLMTIMLLFIILVGGCSTMKTEKGVESVSALVENQPYQIRVRSGHSIMDQIIYDFALLEFGKYLAVSKRDAYMGIIEIIFAGTSGSSFLDSPSDFTTGSGIENAWYTGSGYIGLSGSDSTRETDSMAGSTSTQESTMLVNIKGSQGERFWTADYKYKRDLELSGFTTDTEDKAAKLCIKRIVEKLKDDFPAISESTGENR